ncbi:hypothetical protein [Pseudobacillus wudalianchiensis]|uniref:Uncharacterized protein n=1 Tax=Pseudobacillus wudalianchiensis TaxID=1743143 RepID=A0A1B9AMI6_9BACI|nr:hypothetical protein [Bacillus wudalianchiensis]OCA85134.1 hypothetical protein A8F95_10650 [Bacillus wudalianchiensis]
MNNETYLDFCFIRPEQGEFKQEVDRLLAELFSGKRLKWYLEEKKQDGLEVVVAEVKGMSNWSSEEELVLHLEDEADERFWNYIQGYQFYIYPFTKGCGSCGTH